MTEKKLPTVDIHGKEYVLVKDRILAFHEQHKDGEIQTEITITGESVLAKAIVKVFNGTVIKTFTGHSEAVRGVSSGITGQSPVEVAETSAVGRALGMLGIGILESVASADEIRKAPQGEDRPVSSKPASQKQKDFILKLLKEKGRPVPDEPWFHSLDMTTAKKTIDGLLGEVAKSEPVIDPDGDVIIPKDSEYDPNLPF